MSVTGKQFNEKYVGSTFVILTNESENHNGYQFVTGLNENIGNYNSVNSCKIANVNFYNFNEFPIWLTEKTKHLRYVTVPDNAQVYVDPHKVTAGYFMVSDKLVLSERHDIASLDVWNDSEFCDNTTSANLYSIKFVQNQTENMCLNVVSGNGSLLKYIKNPTDEILLAAVRTNYQAFAQIKNKTPEICLQAVKRNPFVLEYIEDQTDEMCHVAVNKNPYVLRYVKTVTPELRMLANYLNMGSATIRDEYSYDEPTDDFRAQLTENLLALRSYITQVKGSCL
jgi:hypothetical protein